MRTALATLFWRELEGLFFSPLAYIVLTVFLALNGLGFDYALEASQGRVSDTLAIFFGDGPLFWVGLLIVPALVTMRLVAEERRTGVLEVTLTAPVRDGEVVLAKYLGAMAFQGFLWAPTLVYIAIIRNYGALPDVGRLMTAYVGVFAVTSLLTAMGLLFSTLTTNQIVAAVGSITANLLLVLTPVLLEVKQFTALRDVLATVSVVEHFAGSFGRGVLDSSILAFYVAGTAGLLVLASRSLELRKWS